MNTGQKRYLFLLGPFLSLLVVLACSGPKPASTPTGLVPGAGQTIETASYKIRILVEAAITMPTADQFEGAKEGEVMALMAHMAMMDQGQSVNRHLQVHIYDKGSGTPVKDATPVVSFTNKLTGASQGVPNITACLLARHKVFPHFGNNLYLPDGKYTITVSIGQESARLEVSL